MSWLDPDAAVRIDLSSGDHFYVAATMDETLVRLRSKVRLVRLGRRWVNPAQVAQVYEEIPPSIVTPEKLED